MIYVRIIKAMKCHVYKSQDLEFEYKRKLVCMMIDSAPVGHRRTSDLLNSLNSLTIRTESGQIGFDSLLMDSNMSNWYLQLLVIFSVPCLSGT